MFDVLKNFPYPKLILILSGKTLSFMQKLKKYKNEVFFDPLNEWQNLKK